MQTDKIPNQNEASRALKRIVKQQATGRFIAYPLVNETHPDFVIRKIKTSYIDKLYSQEKLIDQEAFNNSAKLLDKLLISKPSSKYKQINVEGYGFTALIVAKKSCKFIVQHCQNLQSLTFCRQVQIMDSSLKSLTKLKQLTRLKLGDCRLLTRKSLSLFSRFRNLKKLIMHQSDTLGDSADDWGLMKDAEKLESLTFGAFRTLTLETVVEFFVWIKAMNLKKMTIELPHQICLDSICQSYLWSKRREHPSMVLKIQKDETIFYKILDKHPFLSHEEVRLVQEESEKPIWFEIKV